VTVTLGGQRCERPSTSLSSPCSRFAKLDRLARNVELLARVMNSDVDSLACDNAAANRLTLHILAAAAEAEAKAISERTTAALAAAKARGVQLGSARPGHWNGRNDARLAGLAKARERAAEAQTRAAREAYADLARVVTELRGKGLSLTAIAGELNEQGHTTRRGRPWNPVQVARVLQQGEQVEIAPSFAVLPRAN